MSDQQDKPKVVADDDWKRARLRWELTPNLSFGEIAKDLGVSRQRVYARATSEGWERAATLGAISQRAHRRADVVSQDVPGMAKPAPKPRAPKPAAPDPAPASPEPTAFQTERQAVEEQEVELRARVLARHRKEWVIPRRLTYLAARNRDQEMAKTAKYIAETTRLVQEGERKAYGLDIGDDGPTGGLVVQRAPSPDDQ